MMRTLLGVDPIRILDDDAPPPASTNSTGSILNVPIMPSSHQQQQQQQQQPQPHQIFVLPRPQTPPTPPPQSSLRPSTMLSFGVVCSSNINRSMEAHLVFKNSGLHVQSYGTGTTVRLPGRSAMEPRIFKFGSTTYQQMYESLSATVDDEMYFSHIGVLQLCQRGAAVKNAPQRWQDTSSYDISQHDVVIAFEERIFDAVIEDLQIREPTDAFAPIHVICLDTKDNPQEAQRQGRVALELCWLFEQVAKWKKEKKMKKQQSRDHDIDVGGGGGGDDDDNDDDEGLVTEIPLLLEKFEEKHMKDTDTKLLYQLCYL